MNIQVGPDGRDFPRKDQEKERDQLLVDCYFNSLNELIKIGDRTIAFPTISTGIFVFPNRRAADIALHTVRTFLEGDTGKDVDLVVFAMFAEKDWNMYEQRVP